MGAKLQRPPANPALNRDAQERRRHLENRLADGITRFAGSMKFVYLHLIWFGTWIGFRVENYPFGLLTMVVSLEAIFLSTFVMISQNRADEKRQALADLEWQTVQDEARQNERLLQMSDEILHLTRALHATTTANVATAATAAIHAIAGAPADRSARGPDQPADGVVRPQRVQAGAAVAGDAGWSS